MSSSQPLNPPEPLLPTDAASSPSGGAGSRQRLLVLVFGILATLAMGAVVALAVYWKDQDGDTKKRNPLDSRAGAHVPEEPPVAPECQADYSNPPKLVVDLPNNTLEIGALKQGEVRELSIGFRNDGPGVLCVKKVEGSCGCLKASFFDDQRKWEPGQSGRVKIVVNTANIEGQIHKRVNFYTNDPNTPIHTYDVKAEVALGLVAPGRLDFGRVTKGASPKAVAKLRSPKEAKDWTVTGVTGSRLYAGQKVPYEFSVRDVEDPKFRYVELTVTRPPFGEQASFQDVLTVTTSFADRPEVTFQSWIEVVPPVRAVPPRAVLGYAPPAHKVSVRLIPASDQVRFKVTGTRWEMPGGKEPPSTGSGFVAKVHDGNGGEAVVDIDYDGKSRQPGAIEATLVVTTDLPDQPEIRVPANVTVAAPR